MVRVIQLEKVKCFHCGMRGRLQKYKPHKNSCYFYYRVLHTKKVNGKCVSQTHYLGRDIIRFVYPYGELGARPLIMIAKQRTKNPERFNSL